MLFNHLELFSVFCFFVTQKRIILKYLFSKKQEYFQISPDNLKFNLKMRTFNICYFHWSIYSPVLDLYADTSGQINPTELTGKQSVFIQGTALLYRVETPMRSFQLKYINMCIKLEILTWFYPYILIINFIHILITYQLYTNQLKLINPKLNKLETGN